MWKGYESQQCTHAFQSGLLGGPKSSPVKHNKCYSPQAATPNWRSAGPGSSWCLLLTTGRFSSSGWLSSTGRSLKLLPQSVLQPAWRARPNIYVCCSVLWTLPPSTGGGGGPQLSSNVVWHIFHIFQWNFEIYAFVNISINLWDGERICCWAVQDSKY